MYIVKRLSHIFPYNKCSTYYLRLKHVDGTKRTHVAHPLEATSRCIIVSKANTAGTSSHRTPPLEQWRAKTDRAHLMLSNL
jgi:hypothetical protein